MTLSPGTQLGPYEVLGVLGAGGMGEVYRARDLKLNRHVALTILPAAFAADRERLARFRREAQLLASLSHPHIGHIYGLEDSDAVRALVLELIEGQTLADRIAQGPVPIADALAMAKQINHSSRLDRIRRPTSSREPICSAISFESRCTEAHDDNADALEVLRPRSPCFSGGVYPASREIKQERRST